MVMIRTRYAGELRVEAQHLPSGTQLHTDAPVDNHGKGASFSPTDLVATALGACIATIMGIVGERHGIALEGMSIDVEKSMVTEPARRIGKLAVHVRVPGDLDDRQKKLLEQAAKGCPVHHSLHPDIEIPIHYTWNADPAPSLESVEP